MMYPQARTLNPKVVLRRLRWNEQFHFFVGINDYTGKSARNLAQFSKIIDTVNKKSVIFHFERHDFERWVHGTLHDPTLARRINKLKKPKTEEKLSEEEVRTLIHQITKNRIKELKNRLPKKRDKKHSKSTKAKKHKSIKRKTKNTKKTTK